MSDWPNALTRPGQLVISPLSQYTEQQQIVNGTGAPATQAWPTANGAVFIPVVVPQTMTVVKMATYNGTTASGNLDLGIYDQQGNRLVSMGSTAQSGTSAWQVLDITDTVLTPNWYYLAAAMDGTTGTMFRSNTGGIHAARALGMQTMTSAFPLPATATFAVTTTQYIPLIIATGVVTV